MGRKFAEIAFTEHVRAAQQRHGSRRGNEALERAEDAQDRLTTAEIAFIQGRDSFYQATVSSSGWPYVQFRGGPPGFLKVLDERTLAYADFRGNAQYLSVGNLAGEARVALILLDYANRRRLKIWATASLVEIEGNSELLRLLHDPGYRARVERAVVLRVVALDWNCPQHITPRFTRTEIANGLADLPRGRTAGHPAGSCGAAGLPPAGTPPSDDAFRNP